MGKFDWKILIPVILLAAAMVFILNTCKAPKIKYKVVKAARETKKPRPPAPAARGPKIYSGKVAIVIDDWGYTAKNIGLLKTMPGPVTIAILPDLEYSDLILKEARENGYKYILHLPLESKSNKAAEKDTIYCRMSDQEIKNRLRQALKKISGAIGVNNHQGSKATEDKRVMRDIMAELKRSGLFFLDSVTTNRSVSAEAAEEAGIRMAKRDVFLDTPAAKMDDKGLSEYVRNKLQELADIATRDGSAIGVGHDKKVTLTVLRDEIPKLREKGIKFVFVSELAE